MQKVVDKPVQVGEKTFRHTIKLFDDLSEPGQPARARQIKFLQEFVDQPALLQCGPTNVQKMVIFHDGSRWVLHGESEATAL